MACGGFDSSFFILQPAQLAAGGIDRFTRAFSESCLQPAIHQPLEKSACFDFGRRFELGQADRVITDQIEVNQAPVFEGLDQLAGLTGGIVDLREKDILESQAAAGLSI